MAKELTFRKFHETDFTRISEFRKTFFAPNLARSCEPEYYRWKCYDNPFQQGVLWLAEDCNIVVGIKSITPKKIKMLDLEVDGAEMGDSFTHPEYQRRGIFTKLSKAARESALEKGIGFIYNTPGKSSLPGYEKKLNHVHIPVTLRNLIKPININREFKQRPHSSLLMSIPLTVIENISRVMFKISAIGIAKSDIFISQVSSFPDDIDIFGKQASTSYDIMLVRSKDYLDWRYVKNPDTYSILIARDREGAILGYIVTKISSRGVIRRGAIADFFTFENDPNIFKRLVFTSFEEFYRREVSVISTWAIKGGFYDKILLRFGFFPRSNIPLLCFKNKFGSIVNNRAYKWHFTIGDTDNI